MSQSDPGWLAENSPATPIDEADVSTAIRDFILAFVMPNLEPDDIVQGRQSPVTIPSGVDGLVAINVLSSTQCGSTVEGFSLAGHTSESPGILKIRALMRLAVQVDFHGHEDAPRQRAQSLVILARSSIGARFFGERGLSVLYAEEVSEKPFDDVADQYLKRYCAVLHFSLWCGNDIEAPYFDTVQLARIKNATACNPITLEE